MDLHEQAERFYMSKASASRSPHTIATYKMHISDFLKWCDGAGYTASDLVGLTGAETIEEHFLHMRIDRNLRDATVIGRFRALRSLYRWIERRSGPLDGGSPFLWLTQPSQPELLPKHITFAEFTLLFHSISITLDSIKGDRWLNYRDRLIIKTLFYTGLRASELLLLRIEDIDWRNRKMRVMRWKTGIEQLIPLSRSLADDMRAWLDNERPDVPHDGLWPIADPHYRPIVEPLHYWGLRQILRRRCKIAGLKDFGAHAFRHGCAAHIVNHGGDITLVKDLLGHRSIETTQVYLRFDMTRLQSGLDRIFE